MNSFNNLRDALFYYEHEMKGIKMDTYDLNNIAYRLIASPPLRKFGNPRCQEASSGAITAIILLNAEGIKPHIEIKNEGTFIELTILPSEYKSYFNLK